MSSFKLGEDFESCYGKFFSGQTRSSVYGFRVLSLGVCIDGVLYPLYFEYVRKKSKASKKPEAIKQVEKLVHKFGNFINLDFRQKNIMLNKVQVIKTPSKPSRESIQ